jgi:hypothetical protein
MNPANVSVGGLLIVCGIGVLIIPVIHYVWAGWSARRKDIMDGFDHDARVAYFQMFGRSELVIPVDASKAFLAFHSRWYGRRFFFIPSLLFLAVGGSVVVGIALSGMQNLHYLSNPLFNLPRTAMAALAGAYLWVANDLISRARRLDMSPSDIMWAALRLSIAVPMGYGFASIVKDSVGPFIAFALGAFPLDALTSLLKRLTNKTLGTEDTSTETSDDIVKLQGINRAIVERLAKDDINTITQIAYCDPVRLIMRSSLTFNFVTDCMNQALAWMYLQTDLDKIRPMGLRGAAEIRCLISELDDTDPNTESLASRARAEAALPLIAAAIHQDPATVQLVFRQIAGDPYTIFLERVWTCGTCDPEVSVPSKSAPPPLSSPPQSSASPVPSSLVTEGS